MFKIGDKVRLEGSDNIGIVDEVEDFDGIIFLSVTWLEGVKGHYSARQEWFEAV